MLRFRFRNLADMWALITLNQILSQFTGQPIDRIARDVDRDYIMSAEQAVEYGMIDRVLSSRELAPQMIITPLSRA